ncbi:crotonase/enoyl-CoA hydratase family protein [Nocardioides sp. cx-173]|uniref:crotonase/enoyl-CoA hydratase family protein n=1 Tax=Nocardioides sp. cx-173 TaxID=2898796 RepID=UPI001E40C23D|nr:crotonase/enoyl-CoA hydratase family protein [Nocardioides sp. cx-173]MCD4524288.1 crotonase/enoyl-CoA hydratase family protein [Nocardioides sp. cx-173]UGB41680.1 crotonase/enoyl-CoA hydratase family protein [Nocardioides sp. cx-173]
MSEVLLSESDGVLQISINRAEQRNAVNGAVSRGIAEALDLLDATSHLRVGVLHGIGSTFCAGMDLKAFAAGEQVRDDVRGFAGLVEKPPAKPLIAAVEGWALGGGFEIALSCDLVTAGTGAKFGLPEVKRGLAARGGGVFRLPRRLPHMLAMELILTGAALTAEKAAQFGLVNRLVEDGQALDAAMELAREIAANAPMSVRASKRVAIESADWPIAEGFVRQRQHLEAVFGSEDAAEGVAAFRERRDPVWQDR